MNTLGELMNLIVDTPKSQTPRQLCNQSERCLTCRHF